MIKRLKKLVQIQNKTIFKNWIKDEKELVTIKQDEGNIYWNAIYHIFVINLEEYPHNLHNTLWKHQFIFLIFMKKMTIYYFK